MAEEVEGGAFGRQEGGKRAPGQADDIPGGNTIAVGQRPVHGEGVVDGGERLLHTATAGDDAVLAGVEPGCGLLGRIDEG